MDRKNYRKSRTNYPRLNIINQTPGIEHIEIKGARLPTQGQVLLSYMARMDQQNQGKTCQRTVINAIIENVEEHFENANIPLKDKSAMAKDIDNLNKTYQNVNKKKNPSRIAEFQNQLKSTMTFWPRGTLEKMKKKAESHLTPTVEKVSLEEDIKFLESMLSDRSASYSSKDIKHAERANTRLVKEGQEMKRQEEYKSSKLKSPCTLSTLEEEEEEEEGTKNKHKRDGDDEGHLLFTPPSAKRSHKRTVKTGITLEITPDFLQSPELQQRAQRCGITPTALAATFEAFFESQGGDTSKVNLSYSQAWRYRAKSADTISTRINQDWTPPSKGVIHWDGKLMDTLDHSGIEDRLPILISGIGGAKLLGVPALPHKSSEKAGNLISAATVNLLTEWKCADSVIGMVFDTTATNTGHITGGCVAIQRDLNRPLLWLACRHHVGEVLLEQVWSDLKIETSKSPEVTVFSRFKANWGRISYNDIDNLCFATIPPEFQQQRQDLLTQCQLLLQQSFVRCDYKELVQLSVLYLSGQPDKGFCFYRPGAMHRARWMAKLIYTIKMVLLAGKINDELDSGAVFAAGQLEKIQRFVYFCIFTYVPWWMACPVSSTAPKNDMVLWNTCKQYTKTDKVCATAATNALSRHLWYLTEELVLLSLFSHEVPDLEKEQIVTALNEQPREVDPLRFFWFASSPNHITCRHHHHPITSHANIIITQSHLMKTSSSPNHISCKHHPHPITSHVDRSTYFLAKVHVLLYVASNINNNVVAIT